MTTSPGRGDPPHQEVRSRGPRRSIRHRLVVGGGSRLTGLLVVVALLATGNAVTGIGSRLLAGRHGAGTWVGPTVEVGLALVSAAWALTRVRANLGADQPTTPVAAPAWARTVATAHVQTVRRAWFRVARWVVTVVALVVAGFLLAQQWPALEAGLLDLRRVRVTWVRLALYAEALSLVAFAYVQRQLLRAGGISLGLGSLVEISVAGNALRTSLPGGAAWAGTFTFDQLRRRGADRVLAVYVVVVAWLMSSLALIVLFVVSVLAGGSSGLAGRLRTLAIALGAVLAAGALVTVLVRRYPGARGLARGLGLVKRVPRWGASLRALVRRLGTRTSRVPYTGPLYVSAYAYAVFNWVTDCACLVACVVGVAGRVPLPGLLIVYTLAQLGATLPITPGGLGVVEGTLTLGLVSYGISTPHALASVLLYRVVSFWILIPIGWAMWGVLAVQGRRRVTHDPSAPGRKRVP